MHNEAKNMNIFLDANIVYKDPFFKKSYPKKLLEYSEAGLLRIYVSSIVKDEILNNYKKEIQAHWSKYKTAAYGLNEYLSLNIDEVIINVDEEYEKCVSFYQELEDKGTITIFEYDNSLLPKLIQRSLEKKKPFDTNKTELRDATIWMSIVEYVQTNTLKDCFLISNNSNDFFNHQKDDLHEDLKNDLPDMQAYVDVKSFFDDYADDDHLSEIKNEMLLDEFIEDESIDDEYVVDLLNNNFATPLSKEFQNALNGIHPHDLGVEIFDGYVDPEVSIDCLSISNLDIDKDLLSQTIIIRGTAEIAGYADIYAYNPVYDSKDEKFSLYESLDVSLNMDFDFSYDLDCEASNISIANVRII